MGILTDAFGTPLVDGTKPTEGGGGRKAEGMRPSIVFLPKGLEPGIMKLLLVALFLFSSLTFAAAQQLQRILDGQARVEYAILGDGYHRELSLNFTLEEPEVDKCVDTSCILALLQHFPREAYVDPYQLEQNHVFGGPRCVISRNPNLESLSSSATSLPHLVTAYKNLTATGYAHISIPFHLRYQLAALPSDSASPLKGWRQYLSPDEPRGTIHIAPPTVLISCQRCPLLAHLTSEEGVEISPGAVDESHHWIRVVEPALVPSTLSVPVGNLLHAPLVKAATTGVLWVTAVLLAIFAWRNRVQVQKSE
ncbi:hypothetical protein PAPYR_8301 [Paratrimastix pyriformis]|uniref:Phosphatidylinositol-glycan biosynthesis class X protein n=1 Tax=Paratrimastix pyriformis TaxID=342808 RepID=A0ABQ8UB01_9EUKA|nr:hypothetical protein PAPYR_8301 [Paratrimastix pyriformis]